MTVHVVGTSKIRNSRAIEIGLSAETANQLILAINRLKQTTITLQPGVEELLTGLTYVMVADPASVAAHRRMEASKGMLPEDSGGTRPDFLAMRKGEEIPVGEALSKPYRKAEPSNG
jgi:hypothetical protein